MNSKRVILRHLLSDAPQPLWMEIQKRGLSYTDFFAFDLEKKEMVPTPESLILFLEQKFYTSSLLPPTIEILSDMLNASNVPWDKKSKAQEVLLDLPNIQISESDLSFSLDAIRKECLRNKIIKTVDSAGDKLQSDPDAALKLMLEGILRADSSLTRDGDRTTTLEESIDSALAKYESYRQFGSEYYKGIKTGFSVFDEETGGLELGTLTVLAAYTGRGKSASLLHIALHALAQDKHVVFATSEMLIDQQLVRLLGMASGLSYRKVHFMSLSDGEYETLRLAAQSLRKKRLHWIPPGRSGSLSDISAELLVISQEYPVDLIIVDYLNIIEVGDLLPRSAGGWERQGAVARAFKRYSQAYRCPVVTAAQLTRASERKERPTLADMGLSHEIAKIADYVLIMTASPMGRSKRFRFFVGKARWAQDMFAFDVLANLDTMQLRDEGIMYSSQNGLETLKSEGIEEFLKSEDM